MEASDVAMGQNVNVINPAEHKSKGISDKSWEIMKGEVTRIGEPHLQLT